MLFHKNTNDYLAGKLDEIDERITMISSRIDQHIAACTTRYFMLVSGIIAIGMLIIGAVTLIVQQFH